MTTELLFQTDMYLTEFESEITKIEDNAVWLSKTAFYPTGGGQPHDVGTMEIDSKVYHIVDVQKDGHDVKHVLEEDSSDLSEGQKVIGKIDWETRYKYQRTHTAMHILCGIIYQEFDNSLMSLRRIK